MAVQRRSPGRRRPPGADGRTQSHRSRERSQVVPSLDRRFIGRTVGVILPARSAATGMARDLARPRAGRDPFEDGDTGGQHGGRRAAGARGLAAVPTGEHGAGEVSGGVASAPACRPRAAALGQVDPGTRDGRDPGTPRGPSRFAGQRWLSRWWLGEEEGSAPPRQGGRGPRGRQPTDQCGGTTRLRVVMRSIGDHTTVGTATGRL